MFFDNLQVTHIRGQILEEKHYYPFGLTMAGISSKALKSGYSENKYKFNGIEQNNDFDINMYDAFYRNLDPQIGRFWQVDPVTTHSESPYVAMQNNPVLKMDWLGDYFRFGNSTIENTYNRLREENSKKLQAHVGEIVNMLSTGEGTEEQLNKAVTLANSHAELNSQWDAMEESDVEYNVTGEMPTKGSGGDTKFSMSENRVNIRLGGHQKDLGTMAHEFRHGYGFLIGEMVGGGNGLSDQMDEVAAFQAGFLFTTQDAIKMVANGKVAEWFKTTQLSTDLYKHLTGKEVQLTINTPAATYMKYYNDRLSMFMQNNKSNANMTVRDAMDAADQYSQNLKRGLEYKYGDLLKNRDL